MNAARRFTPTADGISSALLLALALSTAAVLAWPLMSVVVHGIDVLAIDFLLSAPRDAGRSGGVGPILVSTSLITMISLAVALPLAFSAAVVLGEVLAPQGLAATVVRGSLDVLAGVPSVVFGLFGLSLFCRTLGLGYSIAAGGLTLACMILPTLARSFGDAFEATGRHHRVAAAALGLSRAEILWRVTVPIALPGLCAGVLLALTRALAETALLLFTSGYSDRMPGSVLDSGRSISVHIYELSTNVPGGMPSAYGSALVLLLLLAMMSYSLHLASRWMHHRLTGDRHGFNERPA